jgi:hypothetical protein
MTVDELVVELKLDPSNFTKGQREALDSFKKTSDEFDKRLVNTAAVAENAGYSLGNVSTAAIGLASTLAGVGLVSWARDTMNTAAATGRMATNVGIATKELSAFGKMIEANGGSADEANSSLKGLADTLQNAKWGQVSTDFLIGLNQVGGGLADSPIQIAEKLARFADTHNAQEVNQTGARLGLSQSIINEALRGSINYLKDYKEAWDVALTQDQVDKLQATQREIIKLEQALRSLATTAEGTAAAKLNPYLQDPMEAIRKDAAKDVADARAQGKIDPVASILSWAFGPPKANTDNPNGAGGTADLDRYASAIAAVESRGSGGYNAVGPPTSSGDRPLGKYQVMASNVGPWSRAALGREMSASEFLASPEAQDAIFKYQFGKYVEKYGNPQDAASAWFTGRPQSAGSRARDSLGTSGADYVRKFDANLARGGVGDREGLGGVHIDSVEVNVTTNSTSPRDHGRIAADALRSSLAKQIADNANSGQTRQ